MFGLIISGRPVDASPQSITETQYAFTINPSPPFNHIVVFQLPGTTLPPNSAATVWVQIPPSPGFKLLGGIGPGKESAIFKVSGLKSSSGDGGDVDIMVEDSVSPTSTSVPGEIVVGVSIEPAQQVEAQLATLQQQQQAGNTSTALVRVNASPITTKVLAKRIIGNAFNFLASFGSDVVPLKAFQDWWTKFEKKVELDPSFLEREDQG